MADDFRYSDEELIARFQEGDEQAYIELVNRYRDRLMNFVYRFVDDMEKAEDIVQDTLMKLYTHKHYYRDLAKFSTWIYTIAGNLAKTELRRKKRHKVTNLSHMIQYKAILQKKRYKKQFRNFLCILEQS